jgi:hypothetical protein
MRMQRPLLYRLLAIGAFAIANGVIWAPRASASGAMKSCYVTGPGECACKAPQGAWACGYNSDGTPTCREIYTQKCSGNVE